VPIIQKNSDFEKVYKTVMWTSHKSTELGVRVSRADTKHKGTFPSTSGAASRPALGPTRPGREADHSAHPPVRRHGVQFS